MLNDNDIELVETGDRGAVPVFDGVEHRFPRGRIGRKGSMVLYIA